MSNLRSQANNDGGEKLKPECITKKLPALDLSRRKYSVVALIELSHLAI